jgi:hypothetical protein
LRHSTPLYLAQRQQGGDSDASELRGAMWAGRRRVTVSMSHYDLIVDEMIQFVGAAELIFVRPSGFRSVGCILYVNM